MFVLLINFKHKIIRNHLNNCVTTSAADCVSFEVSIIIIILLLKELGSARLRESDILHPISPKTPAPQYQPIDRKKRNRKIEEDNIYSMDGAAQSNEKALSLLFKLVSPTA